MHFRQRHVSTAEPPPAKRWRPTQTGSSSGADAEHPLTIPRLNKFDHYVTVDEQIEGVVSVVAAPWPTVDASGLLFDGEITSTWFDQADLQDTVDRLREAADQLSRPLRIGDTFWVRGYDETSVEAWQDLRDVTREARAMARVVVAAVAIGDLDATPYARRSARDEEPAREQNAPAGGSRQRRPPSGSATASPVI
jgi:hypothetical protein